MLTITDADLALAAKLGLTLKREAETDRDRADAADPRAIRMPESWQVQDKNNSLIGRIHFTPVDCLYATKYHAGIKPSIDQGACQAVSGPEFFQTPMGQQFYTSTMPRIAKALEQIVAHQERVEKSQAAVEMPLPPASDFETALSEKAAIERVCAVLRNVPNAFIDKIADSMLSGHESPLDDETLGALLRLVRAARET